MTFFIADSAQSINQALFKVTHGLYILTSVVGDKINGQCLDAAMQVTNQPPRIAIGVGVKTLTHEMIKESGVFVVNVIDREDSGCIDKVKQFGFQSGRKVDKFSTCEFTRADCGAPILEGSVAYYECRVIQDKTLELGTHTLFVADVLKAGVKGSGEPYTYSEYRSSIKKGGK